MPRERTDEEDRLMDTVHDIVAQPPRRGRPRKTGEKAPRVAKTSAAFLTEAEAVNARPGNWHVYRVFNPVDGGHCFVTAFRPDVAIKVAMEFWGVFPLIFDLDTPEGRSQSDTFNKATSRIALQKEIDIIR